MAYRQVESVRNTVPILLNHGLEAYPDYCLPSVAAFRAPGQFLLGIDAARFLADQAWDSGLRRLKVVLAGKHDSSFWDEDTVMAYQRHIRESLGDHGTPMPEHVCAAYLAYAMRLARQAVQKAFPNAETNILFNVCMPIEHITNNRILPVFEKVLAAAQEVERCWPSPDNHQKVLDYAREVCDAVRYDEASATNRIFAVPESQAQFQAYLSSLGVQEGLHAVVDFGAGTTDVSIVNYVEKVPTHVTTWLAARNLPRGTRRVESIMARRQATDPTSGKTCSDKDLAALMARIRSQPKEVQSEVKDEIGVLWNETTHVWREAYRKLPAEGRWKRDKVKVFLCGGGSQNPFATDVFPRSWMPSWGPYPIHQLPVPQDFRGSREKAPFMRFSVAYGLTFPKPELGRNILPTEVGSQPPPTPHLWEPPEWAQDVMNG